MSARSDRIAAMVLEYCRCFSEALMHEAASKADISESEAHKWIRRLRVEIDELDALAESVFRCDPDGAPSDSLSHVELTALLDAMDDPTLEF